MYSLRCTILICLLIFYVSVAAGARHTSGTGDTRRLRRRIAYDIVRCSNQRQRPLHTQKCSDCFVAKRYVLSYFDFYRSSLFDDVSDAIAAERARATITCEDLYHECSCIYKPIEAYCERMRERRGAAMLGMAGDSIMRHQMELLTQLCGDAVRRFANLISHHYFLPDEHIDTLLPAFAREHDVVYIGFNLHHLALFPSRPTSLDIFLNYEQYVRSALDTIVQANPRAHIVWHYSNSVCSGKWYGGWRQSLDDYAAMNQSQLHGLAAARGVVFHHRAVPAHDYAWQTVLAAAFDRSGVLLLNNRARAVIEQSYENVTTIESFHLTDHMCVFTPPEDGRHFLPLVRAKLTVLLNRILDDDHARKSRRSIHTDVK